MSSSFVVRQPSGRVLRPPESAPASATATAAANNTLVLSSTHFECTILPPVNSLSGTIVPRLLHKGRRRLTAVQVHQIRNGNDSYEECYIRIWKPSNKQQYRESRLRARKQRHGASPSAQVLDDEDDGDNDSIASLETEISGTNPEFVDAGTDSAPPPAGYEDWTAKYKFPLKKLTIKGTRKSSVVVEIELGKKHEVREVIFDSLQDAEQFQNVLERENRMEKDRSNTKMKVAMAGADIPLDQQLTFLVEICSGWDLPAADLFSSDPYVSCLLNGKQIHKTGFISKTLDPVWTISNGSLFLLQTNVPDLFRSEGLLCIVYDYDKIGNNDRLGSITIPPKTIYDAKGERMEFKLGPPPGKTAEVPGYLAVRIRRATDHDLEFMSGFRNNMGKMSSLRSILPKKSLSSADDATASKGGSGNIKSLVTRRARTAKSGPNEGQKEYKIRPGPDPKRPEETAWMTKPQIQDECMKESTNWIDAGTGQLGRLFVEILGCDDLPNLDTGGFAGNKTDAFVALVHEDSFVTTDIIDDTLSPRWMPWMKRSFIFHMLHSSSQLFLGVFDYDEGINPTDDHDLVGRVSVDLSNLRRDTVYTLTYNIYTTARMTTRKKKGTITLRLRMEIQDERKMLLSTLEPPPQMYVNVRTRRDFRVVRYTCTGKYDMEKYSMKVINSYIEELLALQHILFYIQDGLVALLLWRGTLPMTIPHFGSFLLPVHSLSAFLIAIYLVEHPQLMPSFFFASVAWLMLATNAYRRTLPDLWSRCKGFVEFGRALVTGQSAAPPDSISQYENNQSARAWLDSWEKRITDAEEAAKQAYEEQLKAQEEYEREMEEVGDTGDTDIATNGGGGVSIDPFKGLLFPVQQNLAMACRYVRHVKHVVSWQECYISFWLTIGCLLLAAICMFVPWFFLIKWTARLTMWGLFGPWMKLVDIYYVSKIKPLTEEELAEKKRIEREQRMEQTKSAVSEARLKRERQVKLKAMKRLMFGKFICRVPILKEDRYRDLPTPESHAEPYRPDPIPLAKLAMDDSGYHKTRIPGQHLTGDMIPKAESPGFTEAPIGQPTAHPDLVDKTRPGGSVSVGMDSTAAAYAKLSSLVLCAAVVTWFGVPLLASMTEKILSSVRYS